MTDKPGSAGALTLTQPVKILVAIDGSGPSLEAARYALELPHGGLRAELVLATVQDPTYVYEMILPPAEEVLDRLSGAVGLRALAQAEALYQEAGVAWTREIGSGEPAPTLIEIAARHACTSIVMGARGLGAVRGALMGSVSQGVLQHARVPVTLVKGAGESRA